jgi:hypothetical protein
VVKKANDGHIDDDNSGRDRIGWHSIASDWHRIQMAVRCTFLRYDE